jgi:hypothetical protein
MWEGKAKYCPSAWVILSEQPTAVSLNDRTANRQPDAEAY